MEIYKDIQGLEGLYKISSEGKVLSLGNGNSWDSRTKIPRILKHSIKKNGYAQVRLAKEGKSVYNTIHRLVATHFLEPVDGKTYVNHIDGNKLNNSISNLEWVTQSENQLHAYENGLQKPVRGKNNKRSIKVNQLSLDGELIKTWDGIKEIKREAGFNTFGIINCCKKKKSCYTAYGFKWEYAESN